MERFLLELSPETKDRLESLKSYPDEPYDRVINRLIDSYDDEASLTREEVEGIRGILREMKEGRFVAPGKAAELPAPVQEAATAPAPAGDPRAVKDMAALFSGTAGSVQDQELTPPDPGDTDPGDIHEIDPYDKGGRARTPHLDSL